MSQSSDFNLTNLGWHELKASNPELQAGLRGLAPVIAAIGIFLSTAHIVC